VFRVLGCLGRSWRDLRACMCATCTCAGTPVCLHASVKECKYACVHACLLYLLLFISTRLVWYLHAEAEVDISDDFELVLELALQDALVLVRRCRPVRL